MSQPRASAMVGVACAVSAALLILLTGPLLLFNPLFVRFEQSRHDVPARLHAEPVATYSATDAILWDLFTDGDFDMAYPGPAVFGPLLDEAERSHMRDVGRLVRALVLLDVAALATWLLARWRLRGEAPRRGRLLLVASAAIGGLAIVLGLFFAFAFDATFTAFHSLFFAAGTWQFDADSNLIRLFPEPLWYESALVAGGVIALSAIAVALRGRHDLTRESAIV
jgi:integral membrane protein (TIGR01906 family)